MLVLHVLFARARNVRLQQGRRQIQSASSTWSRWPFARPRAVQQLPWRLRSHSRRRRAWHCVGAIGSILPRLFASRTCPDVILLCPAGQKSLCCRASSQGDTIQALQNTILQEHISVCARWSFRCPFAGCQVARCPQLFSNLARLSNSAPGTLAGREMRGDFSGSACPVRYFRRSPPECIPLVDHGFHPLVESCQLPM